MIKFMIELMFYLLVSQFEFSFSFINKFDLNLGLKLSCVEICNQGFWKKIQLCITLSTNWKVSDLIHNATMFEDCTYLDNGFFYLNIMQQLVKSHLFLLKNHTKSIMVFIFSYQNLKVLLLLWYFSYSYKLLIN